MIAEALQQSLGDAAGPLDGLHVSASIGYGLARSGGLLPLAFMEADRRVYEDKARRHVGRH